MAKFNCRMTALLSCCSGTYSNEGAASADDCIICQSNCNACNISDACITCYNNSYMNESGECNNCPIGQYTPFANTLSSCTACPDGCYFCLNSTACFNCVANYYMNGSICSPCPSGTFSLPQNPETTCSSQICPFWCETCDSSNSTCLTCYAGYNLNYGTCIGSNPDKDNSNNNNSSSGLPQSTIILLSTLIPICALSILIKT